MTRQSDEQYIISVATSSAGTGTGTSTRLCHRSGIGTRLCHRYQDQSPELVPIQESVTGTGMVARAWKWKYDHNFRTSPPLTSK